MDKINFYYFDAWIHPLFLRWMFERDMNLILFFFFFLFIFSHQLFSIKIYWLRVYSIKTSEMIKKLYKIFIKADNQNIFLWGKVFFFFGKIAFFCVLNVFWLFKEKKTTLLMWNCESISFLCFFLNQIKKRSYRLSN